MFHNETNASDNLYMCQDRIISILTKDALHLIAGFAKKIAMFKIRCSGDENSLKDCYHGGYFHGGCRYYEMASVECSKSKLILLFNAFKRLQTNKEC